MARILALVPDLLFASRIEATLAAAGHRVTIAGEAEPASLSEAELVVVDLGEIDPQGLAGHGVPVLGFYSHVDAATRDRALAAGLDLVVPRSRMAREMPDLVTGLLAG